MNYYFYRFQLILVQIFALKKLLLPLCCKLYDEAPNLCVDKTDYSILQDYSHCKFRSLYVHNSNRSLRLFDLSQGPRNKKRYQSSHTVNSQYHKIIYLYSIPISRLQNIKMMKFYYILRNLGTTVFKFLYTRFIYSMRVEQPSCSNYPYIIIRKRRIQDIYFLIRV